MPSYFLFIKDLDILGFKRDLKRASDSVAAKELREKAMTSPRSAGYRSGGFYSQETGRTTCMPRSIGHGPVSVTNKNNRSSLTVENYVREWVGKSPCDIGRDELNAQYYEKKLDSELTTFIELINKKPLPQWQKHFLVLAGRAKKAGQTLILPRNLHRKSLGKLYVEICAFDVMHHLTQAEFEKAILLRSELAASVYNISPLVNYYLDRAVFFAQLSQQTNNLVHITKAYKRANLVCKMLRYFLKGKHFNLVPSERLSSAIKKGLYA